MEFRLTYRGPLRSKASTTKEQTQDLRRHFHKQLFVLWNSSALAEAKNFVDPSRIPAPGDINLVQKVGAFHFAPFVSQAFGWNTVAEIDILFLRPSEPGALIGHGGDLDNRIKSLLDGLRLPSANEIPLNDCAGQDEIPFYCLLQDDALVTELSIRTDRLLTAATSSEVELIIHTRVRATRKSMENSIVW